MMQPKFIETKDDVLAGLAGIPGSGPVRFWLNGVEAKAFFRDPSGEGDNRVIVVEMNYTTKPAAKEIS
jgi:hypothetical protein